MRHSGSTLAPVITLLSPSPAASRRAQEIFGAVFGLVEDGRLPDPSSTRARARPMDVLNDRFQSALLPSVTSMHWDSVASKCPTSGALIHWLAVGKLQDPEPTKRSGSFELLGVTQKDDGIATEATTDTPSRTTDGSSIEYARTLLSTNFPASLALVKLRHFMQRPMTADSLLKRHQGLPVLDLPALGKESGGNSRAGSPEGEIDVTNNNIRLKEVAFTMYDDAVYEDGSTVLSQLSQSCLLRPVTGLYEWPNQSSSVATHDGGGVYLRPLPAAEQDLKGSSRPVVLTFHCESVDRVLEENQALSADSSNSSSPVILLSKIGYTGHQRGQLRLQATDNNNSNNVGSLLNCLPGLDVRWCESTKPTSMFNEAQEALLASSLHELQSPNVLKSTGKQEPGLEDARLGSSDCWVEVRTMVQNPQGFVQRKGPKVATAPPSYPE